MIKESKFKVEKNILVPIILFGIISTITIFATRNLLSSEFQNLFIKQIIWYILGFIVAYTMMTVGNKFLYVSSALAIIAQHPSHHLFSLHFSLLTSGVPTDCHPFWSRRMSISTLVKNHKLYHFI